MTSDFSKSLAVSINLSPIRHHTNKISHRTGTSKFFGANGVNNEVTVEAPNDEGQGPGNYLCGQPVDKFAHFGLITREVNQGHRRENERQRNYDLRHWRPFVRVWGMVYRPLPSAMHESHSNLHHLGWDHSTSPRLYACNTHWHSFSNT